ncbi:hypothetical protein FACS1894190_07820 [Spirochaetia bacterium]|nr:hypothetical protein FACS1894190_07820 [Spirochaetia bacterium]
MNENKLEKICEPVINRLCQYWQLVSIGQPVVHEEFRAEIIGLLEDAREFACAMPELEREYTWIEKPLIFFIDYIVKEGNFPFRYEWRELARNYNELSGDEKFFDIFNETIKYPNAKDSVAIFYIMLSLGFDGVHRIDPAYIDRCKQLCIDKTKITFNVLEQPIISAGKKNEAKNKQKKITVKLGLLISASFLVLCFLINIITYVKTTKSYTDVLSKTAMDAIPKSIINYYQNDDEQNAENTKAEEKKP